MRTNWEDSGIAHIYRAIPESLNSPAKVEIPVEADLPYNNLTFSTNNMPLIADKGMLSEQKKT